MPQRDKTNDLSHVFYLNQGDSTFEKGCNPITIRLATALWHSFLLSADILSFSTTVKGVVSP